MNKELCISLATNIFIKANKATRALKCKKKILHKPISIVRQHIRCTPLSWRGQNPIKLVYKLAGKYHWKYIKNG